MVAAILAVHISGCVLVSPVACFPSLEITEIDMSAMPPTLITGPNALRARRAARVDQLILYRLRTPREKPEPKR